MEPHLFIIQILSFIDSNLVINNLNGLDESIDSVIKRAYMPASLSSFLKCY